MNPERGIMTKIHVMESATVDEWQVLYHKAIAGREQLPIRGNWTETVRRDRKRKRQAVARKQRIRRIVSRG